ncbi:MAG: LysR substrate-binding domain-containing protein, partial [Gammaproteobacteria bacterium]
LKVQMEVGATETIIDMLESGRYLSFLPRFAVGDEIQSGKLHHIRMNQVRMLRTLWIARHRSRLDLAAADAFIEVVRGLQ